MSSKFLFYTTLLFLIATLASQSAMDFFMVLLVLAFLVDAFRQKQFITHIKDTLPGFLRWLLLGWIVAVGASYTWSWYNQGHGVELASDLILTGMGEFKWILVLFTLTWAFTELARERLLSKLFYYFSYFLILASAWAVFIFFYGKDPLNSNPFQHQWGGFYRTGGFLSSPIIFAHLYVLYFLLLLGISSRYWHKLLGFAIEAEPVNEVADAHSGSEVLQEKRQQVLVLMLAVVSSGAAVFLSFTRGVWGAVFAAMLVLVFAYRKKLLAVFVPAVLLAVVAAIQLSPMFKERLLMAFDSSGYDSERIWIWAANLELFWQQPLFGVGYMHNKAHMPSVLAQIGAPDSTLISHAHNQYLHFAAGQGVLGLLCYVLFLGYFLYLGGSILNQSLVFGKGLLNRFRNLKTQQAWNLALAVGAWISIIAFAVGGITESNFEHTKVRYVLLVCMSLLLVLSRIFRATK